MSDVEWAALLLVNLGVSYCYQKIPKKLTGLVQSHHYLESSVEEILRHRANNIHLLRLFIRWCGIHHLFMVPLMFLLMRMDWHPAAVLLIGVDLAVLVVSWQALQNIIIPENMEE